MLYPQRNPPSYPPMENGFATTTTTTTTGPPPTFGNQSLPPLVEHQEEAMFEQIQEMIESAPSPPPSPPPSPQAPPSLPSSHHSSHPVSPVSPSNQLQDDKETLQREIQELTLMEANKPKGELVESDLSLGSEDEGLVPDMDEEKDKNIMSVARKQPSTLYTEDIVQTPKVRENDISTAIKIDTFRVEESSSPLPLSPITEVSSDGESQRVQDHAISPVANLSVSPAPPPPQPTEDPEETLDKELNELMKFSGTVVAERKSKSPTTPTHEKGARPLSDIVTPPPMFDSPPPPKPTSAAPKRVVKRPAPPPPKLKAKQEPAAEEEEREETPMTPVTPEIPETPEKTQPADKDEDDDAFAPPTSSSAQELFQPIQRPKSPDLLAQIQQLAYTKSIAPESNVGTAAAGAKSLGSPIRSAQPEKKKNEPYTFNVPRQPPQPARVETDGSGAPHAAL